MTEIEKTHYTIARKTIEIASDIERLEREMDKVQKVNIYLLRKYREELLKEFPDTSKPISELLGDINKVDLSETMKILSLYDRIAEKMNEEMPEPWYCYGFTSKQ